MKQSMIQSLKLGQRVKSQIRSSLEEEASVLGLHSLSLRINVAAKEKEITFEHTTEIAVNDMYRMLEFQTFPKSHKFSKKCLSVKLF